MEVYHKDFKGNVIKNIQQLKTNFIESNKENPSK